MQSKATTVEQYLKELPPDRREAVSAVRKVILKNLRGGYEEVMSYGMIGYCVPHRIYPSGYHCNPEQPLPFACLASQKHHMAVYLMCVYSDGKELARFREEWIKTGRKLDMGKSCIRFRKLEDLALDVLGDVIRRNPVPVYLKRCELALASAGRHKSVGKKQSTKKAATAKAGSGAAKKTAKAVSKNKAGSKARKSGTR